MKEHKLTQSFFFTRPFKKLSVIFIAVIAIWLTASNEAASQPGQDTSGYVSVNGLNYYYEIHGQETSGAVVQKNPLLLLHGGLGSTEMFRPLLPMLAKNRQVIGIDLHGHGRTALGDRPISYVDMGDDIAGILQELGYSKVDVLGYSMGGGVALRVAIQHPEMIRKLVVVSAGFSHPDGTFPEIIAQQKTIGAEMAESMKGTPMYKSYMKLAPHPEDFPKLLERMGELMSRPFDWSEGIKTLDMPVMLIYGDSDMLRPEHMVDFYQLLGDGLQDAGWQREHMTQNRLAILPNLTHYDIFMAPEMVETSLTFLNGETKAKNWSEQVEKSGN